MKARKKSETKDYLDSMAMHPAIQTEKVAVVLAFTLCAVMYGMLFLTNNIIYFFIGDIIAFVGIGVLFEVFSEKEDSDETK